MKRIILSLLLISSLSAFAQKEQDPDTLVWNNRHYTVTVERDVPSLVMVYFQRTNTPSPFNFWSANLNRGHVARFEILNNEIYLTRIDAKRYRTRTGNLWTESGIDTSVAPGYFNIKPLETHPETSDDLVIADWFSGIIELTLITNDKKELKSTEAKGNRYLHIIDGKIVDNVFISTNDRLQLQKNPDTSSTISKFLTLRERYLNFHQRCAMDREAVDFDGHKGLFEHQPDNMTLVMNFFGNNPLRTPSAWNRSTSSGAPFGSWIIQNDSLFLSDISTHSGDDPYSFISHSESITTYLADSIIDDIPYNHRPINENGAIFADWIDGNYVIHYGNWESSALGLPSYNVYKTQKLRIKDGIILSSSFTPSSFEDDEKELAANVFNICNENGIWSVDDKQLAENVGNYKQPKTNPTYKGGKPTFRSWFLNNPLTDERAKDRLFRVRLGFMVNCNGEAGRWIILNKGKGELFEFANMVLDLVKTMPQNWEPAKDKKGNNVDCWQIMEFTVNNGILTNANYK